jgi:hypothetical protein
MRLRTAIAAGALSAAALLGSTAGPAFAQEGSAAGVTRTSPHPPSDHVNVGTNICNNQIVSVLSPVFNAVCQNRF